MPGAAAAATAYDVVIVGAGVSGLAAAHELAKHHPELSVAVFEAMNRVGGRLLSDDDGVDLGGAYFGPGQRHLLALVGELKVPLWQLGATGGDAILAVQRRAPEVFSAWLGTNLPPAVVDVRNHFDGLVPTHDPAVAADVRDALGRIDRLARTIPIEHPELAPNAKALDGQSIAHLLRSGLCATDDAAAYLSLHFQALHTVNATQLSALSALWFVHCAGGMDNLLAGECCKFVGGAQNLPKAIAAAVGSHRIHLETAVRAITANTGDGGVTLECVSTHPAGLGDGRVPKAHAVVARRVILAIPPPQIHRIAFSPALPGPVAAALQRMPLGYVVKTFTYYKRAFWREQGLSGRILTNTGICIDVYDDTKADGSEPCLMGLVGAGQGMAFAAMTKEQRHKFLQEHYHNIFQGEPEALASVNYKEKSMSDEPWVGGGFFAVAAPGCFSDLGRLNCGPFLGGRVLVAGTEGANCWVAYVNGAIEAGKRQARAIARELRPEAAMSDAKAQELDAAAFEAAKLYDGIPKVLFGPAPIVGSIDPADLKAAGHAQQA